VSARILKRRFRTERKLHKFVAADARCRQAILEHAGLRAGAADLVKFKTQIHGATDLVCKVERDGLAIVELCFALTAEHAWKDLWYLVDPGNRDKIVALIWVCDSVSPAAIEMIRFFAAEFGLERRVTLEVLLPQDERFDRPTGSFRFGQQLSDLRGGTPRARPMPRSLLHDLNAEVGDRREIDSTVVTRLFGVSGNWRRVASQSSERRAPRLALVRTLDGTPVKGDDGRLYVDAESVRGYIADSEAEVARKEAELLDGEQIAMVSCKAPEIIEGEWWPLARFHEISVTKNRDTIRKHLGRPVAFCIGKHGAGFSLLWPRERMYRLRLVAIPDDGRTSKMAAAPQG